MYKIKKLLLLFSLCLVIFTITFPNLIFAQGIEMTSVFTVIDDQAQDGDIMMLTDKGITRDDIGYDKRIFGVLQKSPIAALKNVDQSGQPIARTGIAEVNVTTLNGPINPGDYITSSDIIGKGQKATITGYILGRALTGFKEGEGEQIDYKNPTTPTLNKKVSSGKISVALRIEYLELTTSRQLERVFGPFGAAIFANVQNPQQFSQVIRYLAAGIIALVAFLVGFFTFSRSVSKAVEAIGRNPLAKTSIYISIGINIFFTLLVALIGVVLAIIVLRI